MRFLHGFYFLGAGSITKFQAFLVTIFLIKITFSAVTVSFETGARASELIADSILARSSPWGFVNWLMYQFWFAMPIDKSHLLSNPESLATPGLASSSLLLTLKLPAIFLDTLIASALYWHVKLASSAEMGRRVLIVWLTNPFTTLTIEMLGSMAILSTSLFLLTILVFSHQKSILAAVLAAATLAVEPILTLAIPIMWAYLARTRRVKMLFLHIVSALAGLGAFIRWSTDLGLDPYRLVRVENQFMLGLVDLFADPFVLFGVGIGLGTTLAVGYVLYACLVFDGEASSMINASYGAVSILFAFSTWNFAILLIILPYLCLLMRGGLVRIMTKATALLIALFPVWALISGTPQLLKSEGGLYLSQLDWQYVQSLLDGGVSSFLLRPLVRSLVFAALLLISLGSSRPSYAAIPSENKL